MKSIREKSVTAVVPVFAMVIVKSQGSSPDEEECISMAVRALSPDISIDSFIAALIKTLPNKFTRNIISAPVKNTTKINNPAKLDAIDTHAFQGF
jgi:hypothetical protein